MNLIPHRGRRALLVTMPWMSPSASCLALATLRPILEQGGVATDTLYASVLFPRTETPDGFLEQFGSFLFVPYLYPDCDVDALTGYIIDRQFEEATLQRLLSDDPEATCRSAGMLREELRARIQADIRRAGVCLERCFARAARPEYDIIGFSLTFETQIPAALALARRLKARDPAVKIAFGGAACMEEQADGIVRSFPVVDAVCHTEGEEVVVPLFRALRGELPLAEVPGIAYLDEHGALRHNPSPPLLTDLDRLPLPRYEDFLQEHAESEWRDVPPRLFFETSRGCWWGQKHLCTFCGLNAEGLAFRSKTPERAYEEIRMLYRDYPQARLLQATDNILDLKYLHTLLPRLARLPRDPGRPLCIFYEVKSNMKPQQVALLAAAGIQAVQPGIEAFDDQILQIMDKGATGLQQVQFLKWVYQEGIKPLYNLLLSNPGEEAAAYRRMIDLLPYITHLPPPSGITQMILERFSPYFDRPEAFGITDRRPRAYYRHLYRDPGVDLDRIAYQFEYDHPMFHDPELRAAVREFAWKVLTTWSKGWRPRRACYVDRGDHLVIYDDRGPRPVVEPVGGVAAEVYRYLDQVRPFAMIARRFPQVAPEFLRSLLERWHHRRYIYRSPGDLHLAVLPLVREQPLPVEQVVAAAAPRKGAGRPAELRVV
jgi:ribosomal peptide maturation radical SAM protein 1